MKTKIKAFDVKRAQAAVADAKDRMSGVHSKWRFFEAMWRYGDVDVAASFVDSGDFNLVDDVATREVVNRLLPHITVIESSIVARDPKHIATPIEGGMTAEAAAAVAEAVLAYFWTRVGATEKVALATHDSVVIGNGFLKVAWDYLRVEEERDEAEVAADWAEAIEVEAAWAELEEREPVDPEDLYERISLTRGRTVRSEPFIEYVSPYDILVDEAASNIDDVRWVAQRVRLPLEEIHANDQYDYEARELATADPREEDEGTLADTVDAPPRGDFEMATVWEFYDMRERRLLVFQEGAEKALYDDDIPYGHRHTPFVHFVNYRPNGTEFWGFGDIEAAAHLQRIHNEMWTEQVDNARRAGSKYVADKAFDTDGRLSEMLESPLPDQVAMVDNPDGRPLDTIVKALERQPLDADIFQSKLDSDEAIRDVLGINDFQAGGSGSDRMSATAAALVDGVATIRASAKAAMVERGVARSGQILLLLAQEFLDEPRAIRISGEADAEWPVVSADDLYGEFLISVEGGSMRSVNPSTREERGMRLLGEIMPIVRDNGYDPEPVLRQGLRDLGFDPDFVLQRLPEPPAPEPGAEGAAPTPEGAPADVGMPGNPALAAQLGGGVTL